MNATGVLAAGLALLAIACVERSVPPASRSGAPAQTDAPRSPTCPPAPPALTSYDAIEEGVRFSLRVHKDEHGNWVPARRLAMPHHHASAIEWRDDEAHLRPHRGDETLVVHATGLGRTSIRHEPRLNTWFATYAARVDSVCAAP